MPLRLTPYEREQLLYMQQGVRQNPDIASQVGSMFFGTLGGAQERFDTNRATRQEGMASLREMAMQLAAQGASEDAVTAALSGQAESLPMMGGRGGERRIGGLEDYVDELYSEGPVSGLAPLDVRAQYGAEGNIDEQLRLEVAQEVAEQNAAGLPFDEIVSIIERGAIARGLDESTTEALRGEAQSVYERLIGTSLDEMRGVGGTIRDLLGSSDFTGEELAQQSGLDESLFQGYAPGDVKGFMAQAVNDPELYAALQGVDPNYEPPSLFQRTIGGLFGPSSGMPFGV